ncbi:hypothetical protein B0H21DRAFT_433315 [Amylocystis lapponica]|nr:hypothetical protein B0H21DRAFT_433315 [Amylocystis lapponica]
MHHCLQVPEILRIIFEKLCTVSAGAWNIRDASCLSLTCRAFHSVGESFVWKHIKSLRPLIKCMPEDVWTGEKTLSFRRPPSPPDWLHFQAKARYVISLLRPSVTVEGLRTMSLFQPVASFLLPNLKKLRWDITDRDIYEYVYMFLGPKLQWLHLGDPSHTATQVILQSLGTRCPLLQKLAMNGDAYPSLKDMEQDVTMAICALKHLHTIIIPIPITNDAVYHLATLPSLCCMKISPAIDDQLLGLLTCSATSIFPGIQYFHIDSIDLDKHTMSIVSLVQSKRMQVFRLSAYHHPSTDTLRGFLDALLHCCTNALTSIHLHFPRKASRPLENAPPDHIDCTIRLHTLSPLLTLHRLEKLEVSSSHLELTNEDIEKIAIAFPELHTLALMPTHASDRIPLVTLEGLIPLLRHCPRLETLRIALNAIASSPNPTVFSESRIPQSSLRQFDVADSPIGSPAAVAAFLSAFCTPQLLNIVCGYLPSNGNLEFITTRVEYEIRWEQVSELMSLFRLVRENERDHPENSPGESSGVTERI